jgi:hypothetical protein
VQHCDDDELALVALGERPSPVAAQHLSACARCRSEVESFGRAVAAGRPGTVPGPDIAPPPAVWDAVAIATGVTVRPRLPDASALPISPPTAGRPDVPDVPDVLGAGGGAPATVTRLRPREGDRGRRGRRGWLPMAAVAASALVVGGIAGSVGTSLLGEESAPAVQVVARTTLGPLPADPAARGTAVVVDTSGTRRLEVDVSDLSRTNGFYEVWLIDASVKKMVPIGILTGTTGDFAIPAGLDLTQYPVVDISAEPLDGNPAHSGKSHLRGVIQG